MAHRLRHLNFAAADGGVRWGPRFQPPPGHAVDQVNFTAVQGGGRQRGPRFQPPRGPPAVFLHGAHHPINSAALDGRVGTGPHFQPPQESAFVDGVFIIPEIAVHQIPHHLNFSAFDGGITRVPPFQPPHGAAAGVSTGGVFVPSPPIPYGGALPPGFYLVIPLPNSQIMLHGGHPTIQRENNIQDSGLPQSDGGLSEEFIARHLKTRTCDETTTSNDDDPKICVVCQDDVCQENPTIGILRCGHEYHASCIKIWLQQKNICPLCKAAAL